MNYSLGKNAIWHSKEKSLKFLKYNNYIYIYIVKIFEVKFRLQTRCWNRSFVGLSLLRGQVTNVIRNIQKNVTTLCLDVA